MFDIAGVLALVACAALFAWLASRAWSAKHAALKWGGLVLFGLLTGTLTVSLVVALVGFYKLNVPPYRNAAPTVTVAGTPEQIARGAKFARFCAGCHSPGGQTPLAGQILPLGGGPPIGVLAATNLTPAGEMRNWSDGEIIRAIRQGVHKSGRALVVMPSESFRDLSDGDVQSIVAYLRSQPATDPNTPPTKLNVIAALFIGSGVFPTAAQAPIMQPVIAPAAGATLEYGKYLVSILTCRTCHGENLGGGKAGPGPPPGPNLALIVPTWSETGFITTLRTGVDPGRHVLGEGMPWREVANFATDEDLRAMYTYVRSLTQAPSRSR